MRNKLIEAIDAHFTNAPRTAQVQELHDEILQNTLDRYDEELASGKNEADAYSAAFASIGDIDALLQPLCPVQKKVSPLRAIAIALYILCVVPVIIGDAIGGIGDTIGTCLMFVIAAIATCLIVYPSAPKATRERKLRAIGIGMYVLCIVPTIFFDEASVGAAGEAIGVSLMFFIAALATVLVVLSAQRGTKSTATSVPTQAAPAAEKEPASLARRIGTPIYWIGAVCIFSFLGSYIGWPVAWVIFPFAGALGDIITGIVLLAKGKPAGRTLCNGLLWMAVLAAYIFVTVETEKWMITWLIFPIGGALHGVLSGMFDLVKGDSK